MRTGDCNIMRLVVCEMQSSKTHAQAYCVSLGADGRVGPQCLHGHEIKTLPVTGVSECGQACWAEPRCRSFNLQLRGPAKICQLNKATRLEAGADYTVEKKCVHFDL